METAGGIKTFKAKHWWTGWKARLFVCLMLAYPVIHWLIFYVYLNFSSILMAFQEYVPGEGYAFLSGGRLFDNFARFFNGLFNPAQSGGENLAPYVLNGAILHSVSVFVGFPASIIFAYLIYKKVFLAETFKVILYLPAILSGLVIVVVFKYTVEIAFGLTRALSGQSAMWTVAFYTAYTSMPGNIILNTSTLSRIPAELIESGKLEGITMWQEFRHIVLPLMYSLLQVYLIGVFVGFFTTSGPLYGLYLEYAPPQVTTFGYYMFVQIIGKNSSITNAGFTAAANLAIGIMALPIVYLTKFVLDKFNPQAEF